MVLTMTDMKLFNENINLISSVAILSVTSVTVLGMNIASNIV